MVYKGTWGSLTVAIKEIDDTISFENFCKEREILKQLQHPHVVLFYDAIENPGEHPRCFVLELMSRSLEDWIHTERIDAPDAEKIRLAHEIGEGLHYLHSLDIAHNDLVPINILLNEKKHAKISDFGLALDFKVRSVDKPNEWIAAKRNRIYVISMIENVHLYGILIVAISSKHPRSYYETLDRRSDHLSTAPPILKDVFSITQEKKSETDDEKMYKLDRILKLLRDHRGSLSEDVGLADTLAAAVAMITMEPDRRGAGPAE